MDLHLSQILNLIDISPRHKLRTHACDARQINARRDGKACEQNEAEQQPLLSPPLHLLFAAIVKTGSKRSEREFLLFRKPNQSRKAQVEDYKQHRLQRQCVVQNHIVHATISIGM